MDNKLPLPDALPENFKYTEASGLTQAEAERLLQSGAGNRMSTDDGKTFGQILKSNFFTLFNFLNIGLGVCLLLVGSYRNMLFLTVVVINLLIGTIQEYRAQQTIRKLQILNAPEVHVLRDGKEITVKPEETVRGDLVILRGGDQVIADAVVTAGGGAAMEALLTGESDPVEKKVDCWLYSGSYITEGRLTAQLVYIADESYAGRLTKEARKTARPVSQLISDLRRLIRFDTILLIPIGVLLFLKQVLLSGTAIEQAVPSSVAAMIGMIPEGLILLASIAMAVGVMKLARRNTLVQELPGIETLARADVLCLDKTGTITTGSMELEELFCADETEQAFRTALSRFLGAFDENSGTLNALRKAIEPGTEKPVAVLPFSSARKLSAAAFQDGEALILGAPDYVLAGCFPDALRERARQYTADGKRVIALAGGRGTVSAESLPEVKTIYGLCVLRDQIRPGAGETFRYFREQGVELKVISGDDSETVSRIAREAGMEHWEKAVDARTLKTDADIQDACERYTIFGRVTPEQKKQLVLALKQQGHSVAMTGDGVNDIPALKTADCSIAMAGGSDAAKHAAQLTLLDSDFTVMPEIVLEGRRVINNITRSASLFLTKTLFSFFLSVIFLVLPGIYPFEPIQLTLISSLMIGFPGFVLSLEPNSERVKGGFLQTVLMRALPGGVAAALCCVAAMLLTSVGWAESVCRTLATLSAGIVCLVVLVRTCRPLNLIRCLLLAASSIGFAIGATLLRGVFKLEALDGNALLALAALAAGGAIITLLGEWLIHKNEGWFAEKLTFQKAKKPEKRKDMEAKS